MTEQQDQDTAVSGFDDLLEDDQIQGEADSTTKHNFYNYSVGDSYLTIDDQDGTDLLMFKHATSREIVIEKRDEDNFCVIFYKGEPVLEMRGVEYIQTADGVFSLERWGIR
ncbi:MAG: hypothetical protein HC919_05395 [Oscillatoriales cyanobacterium SM2_2_1]|nr:hypothetical protein [Oscillatoriales cyanobacterium SM2_2_1]